MQPPPTHQNPDAHQNQSNEANSGTVSAAWRRRQRRRAQRLARTAQRPGSNASTVLPNRVGPSMHDFALPVNRAQSWSLSEEEGNDAEEQEIPTGELLVGDPH